MAEHKDEKTSGEPPVNAPGDPQTNSGPKIEAESELPPVESPPLSPAAEEPAPAAESTESEPALDLKAERAAEPSTPSRSARLSPHRKRQALLAASVLIAAGFGATIGVFAAGSRPAPQPDVAGLAQRKAMQQSIEHLSGQLAALKRDLDKAKKTAHAADAAAKAQIAKIRSEVRTELQDDIKKQVASAAKPEVTGTIPASSHAAAVPVPKPAPRIAPVETRLAATEKQAGILPDWTIRDARGGFIYVQGHGDIYQVVPGARLPGLGPVQSIERRNGRWIVVMPDGIIVAARDRRYFE